MKNYAEGSVPSDMDNASEAKDAEGGTGVASDGKKLVSLLIGSSSWLHRRVDALRLGGDGITRLHVSLDVTVPTDLCLQRPGGQVVVPLAFMEKAALRQLDTEDSSGKSMSVLDAPVNSQYALKFLQALTPRWVQEDSVAWGAVQNVLGDLVRSSDDVESATVWRTLEALLERAAGRREELSNDESSELAVFSGIARQMGEQFLFLVEISSDWVGVRTVLKYSLDQDAPQVSRNPTKRAIFGLVVPDFGFAGSQHIEVELPDGVVLERLTLEETIFQGDVQNGLAIDAPERWGQRTVGHVTLRPSSRFSSGELWVTVVPTKQGLYRFAKASILTVALAVIAAWVVRNDSSFFLRKVEIPSPSASILLVGPALLLSWFSRASEHALVAKVQGPLRLGLLGSALVLLIMAALAAVPVTVPVWDAAWLLVSLIQAASVLLLIYYWGDLGRHVRNAISRIVVNRRVVSHAYNGANGRSTL